VKGTITLLSLLAILLLVIAFAGFGPAFATQLRACQGQGALSGPDAAGCLTAGGSPAVLGFALYLAGVVAALLAWLLGLLKTASIGRWGWFLLVLLLSPLGSLLYGLAGPATRAKA
jgi:hypothetical protein